MSKTPKRSRKSAPKPQPEAKEQLTQEQLDQVSGGGAVIIENPTTTEVRDGGTNLGPAPHLGPVPHLITPKIGQ